MHIYLYSSKPKADNQQMLWTRRKAIQFLEKLRKVLEDVETWFDKVSKKIDTTKQAASASDRLWYTLVEYNTYFVNNFGQAHGGNGLGAITSPIMSLSNYMEKHPNMFSNIASGEGGSVR